MQIKNDYNAHSNMGYQNSHTHHITKCQHEEGKRKQEEISGGIRQEKAAEYTKGTAAGGTILAYGENTAEPVNEVKKKSGFIRGLWDFLGDEEGTDSFSLREEAAKLAGVNMISSAVRHILPIDIMGKWESVRERIKAGVGVALKRFKKERDDFTALSDPNGKSEGKRAREGQVTEKRERGARRKPAEITSGPVSDSHLMDSYNKSGEYCQINENLTYRKKV